jgi:hypothetical protein
MDYRSPRCLADVAEGLIEGCGKHYAQKLQVRRTHTSDDGSEVVFEISREPADG